MGFMTIDRIRVEFTDEPNVLSVIRKADIDIPTLRSYPFMEPAGCVRWRMNEGRHLHHVPNLQGMEWSFIPIRRVS